MIKIALPFEPGAESGQSRGDGALAISLTPPRSLSQIVVPD